MIKTAAANYLKSLSKTQKIFGSGVVSLVVGALIGVPLVHANSSTQQIQDIQQQIKQVEADSGQKQQNKNVLSLEANSINDAISQLQGQIDASQARISQLQGDVDSLKRQITEAEAELARQRNVLGQSIKAMYIEGDISTLEMLATSKDLSEYFDKQQYRNSVQNKIKVTLDSIAKLKADLTIKRASVEATLAEQRDLNAQLASQRAEKDRILAMNQNEQSQLESQLKANSGKIAELKKKQAEAEAAMARALASSSYRNGGGAAPVGSSSVVGAVGTTGLSSGPHLHLEVRIGSNLVNPAPYIKTRPVSMPPAYISQGYGVSNPLYSSGYHRGVDYAAPAGATIYAIDEGTMYRGCSNQMLGTRNNDYGFVAIVEHSNGARSVYAHMSGGPAACNYNTYY